MGYSSFLLAVTAAKYGVSAGTGNSAGAEAGSHAAQRRGQVVSMSALSHVDVDAAMRKLTASTDRGVLCCLTA